MTTPHIEDLSSTIKNIFQDAIVYHDMFAERTGETIHIVAQNEYKTGITILDTLVDENDRFVDHDALVTIRQVLDDHLDEIGDIAPLKKRHLETLLRQIDEVKRVFFTEPEVGV